MAKGRLYPVYCAGIYRNSSLSRDEWFGMGVLMLAPRLAPNSYSDLPSWVPNWKMLRNAELGAPKLLDPMITRSHNFRFDAVSGVASSGAITVRCKILGPVTASNYGPGYMAEERDCMRNHHRLVLDSFNNWETDGSSQSPTNQCI